MEVQFLLVDAHKGCIVGRRGWGCSIDRVLIKFLPVYKRRNRVFYAVMARMMLSGGGARAL
jgi:hypothetical protein